MRIHLLPPYISPSSVYRRTDLFDTRSGNLCYALDVPSIEASYYRESRTHRCWSATDTLGHRRSENTPESTSGRIAAYASRLSRIRHQIPVPRAHRSLPTVAVNSSNCSPRDRRRTCATIFQVDCNSASSCLRLLNLPIRRIDECGLANLLSRCQQRNTGESSLAS